MVDRVPVGSARVVYCLPSVGCHAPPDGWILLLRHGLVLLERRISLRPLDDPLRILCYRHGYRRKRDAARKNGPLPYMDIVAAAIFFQRVVLLLPALRTAYFRSAGG